MEIDIQPLFTHIDAGIDWRHRVWFGQYLALHAGLAPHHLFRTNARTDGPSSSPVLAKGRTVPPVRTPADGHPPGFATFFAQMLQSQHARGGAIRDGVALATAVSKNAARRADGIDWSEM